MIGSAAGDTVNRTDRRICAVFEAQGAARSKVRNRTASERLEVLRRFKDVVLSSCEEVLAALASDLGKPREEAMQDFGAALWEIGLIEAGLEQWMKPVSVSPQDPTAPASAFIVSEPKGRVLVYGPWNFPFALSMQPLVAAVAAGNCVIVKPSEMAPATASIIARIVARSFPEDEVAVVEGGPNVAERLLELPFDHVFFTGSTATGRKVMTAAARNLSSVTLELGGKCPVIIDRTASLADAVGAVAAGKFLNSGQICLAPDHVWIDKSVRSEFVKLLCDQIETAYYVDGDLQDQRLARIVDGRNVERLALLLEDAIDRGATVARGGGINGDVMEPTILLDVPVDAEIMQAEIFGPILPVLSFESINEVLPAAEGIGKPLALYVFSEDADFIDTILAGTSSGGVTINGVMLHAAEPGLPFGGVGASGMGAYHGAYSFAELTHRRSIYVKGAVDPSYCR